MSLEKKILASCLTSRNSFERLEEHLDGKITLPIAELVLDECKEYYKIDEQAKSVDKDWLLEKINLAFDNPKKADVHKEFVKELFSLDVSNDNITNLIIDAKKKELGHKLAMTLANGDDGVDELIEEYQSLKDTKADKEDDNVFQDVSIDSSLSTVLDTSNLIKLPTRALNDAVGGGVMRGHNIFVVARPETGKTALLLAMEKAFSAQGLSGLYFGNEEPIEQTVLRDQCSHIGMDKDAIRANPDEARRRLEVARRENGYGRARFIRLSPGSPRDIERYIKLYSPDWIMVDQIRNLNVRSDTRVNQLEIAATSIRNLANKYNLLAVNVTQAGDSAEGKLVLTMGDVDFSNTGIPAQADLMIMVGVNDEYERNGLRMINLPKNKISGAHVHFPIRIYPSITTIDDF